MLEHHFSIDPGIQDCTTLVKQIAITFDINSSCWCNAAPTLHTHHFQPISLLKEIPMSQSDNTTHTFETKDSGERQQFSTGMVRDVQTDKPRYDLLDLPMLKRWAELMARGAVKYGEDNWRKAATNAELRRFQASALRHLFQWIEGDRSEDHGAAVFFNISGAEMVREKLESA